MKRDKKKARILYVTKARINSVAIKLKLNKIPPSARYPLIVVFALLSLTALNINGSSIGEYTNILYGDAKNDSALIAGEPRPIRSDEWLVNTQLTIAQFEADYPRLNPNIGEGMDMSIVVDVPYRGWSVLFKPQNLAFFILPLEYAFAFKWWFILAVLAIGSYLLTLQILPKKYLLATILSVFLCLSPFLMWWYLAGTILLMGYAFLIMFLYIKIFSTTHKVHTLLYASLLAYILTCFALILYPPFQIPLVLVTTVFLVAWTLTTYDIRKSYKYVAKRILLIFASLLAASLVAGTYIATRLDIINIIMNTVYPGARVVTGGGETTLRILSGHLQPFLQSDTLGANYYNNQSEASSFVLLGLFLMLPSIYLIFVRYNSRHIITWPLIAINTIILLLLTRMYLPAGVLDNLYTMIALDKVPNKRLVYGLGFAGFLQLLLTIKLLLVTHLSKNQKLFVALLGSIPIVFVLTYTSYKVATLYPIFIKDSAITLPFIVLIASGVFFILYKRYYLGLTLLIVFSLVSVYSINPLYRGLGVASGDNRIVKLDKPEYRDATWAIADTIVLENVALVNGLKSINSVHPYPQISLWGDIDTNNEYTDVYNRYAHITFSSEATLVESFRLMHSDNFQVRLAPCDEFFQDDIDYILTPTTLTATPCVKLADTIQYPAMNVNIYKVQKK